MALNFLCGISTEIMLRTLNVHLPFQLCCIQLPVRLVYSMTINKVQGKTFQRVGLDLPKPVFAHGQLYVALSRATTEEGVRVKIQDTEEQGFHNGMAFTQNVIDPDIPLPLPLPPSTPFSVAKDKHKKLYHLKLA